MKKRKTGGGKNPPRNNGRFARASQQKANDRQEPRAEAEPRINRTQNKGSKTGRYSKMMMIPFGILGALIVIAGLIFFGGSSEKDEVDHKTSDRYEIPKEDGRVTREESEAFKNEVITSKVFMIDHKGVEVPWKMRDGLGILRPVKTKFGAVEYQMTGYFLNRNGVRTEAWETVTVSNHDRSSIQENVPTCDVVEFRLTDKTTAKELALKATVDMEWSLDRKLPKMSEKQRILQQLQDPNYGQTEEVAETNTEPTKDEDVPQKADRPSNVW